MERVEEVLKLIIDDPHVFEASRKKELELITFWDNRQDPKKLVYWED